MNGQTNWDSADERMDVDSLLGTGADQADVCDM